MGKKKKVAPVEQPGQVSTQQEESKTVARLPRGLECLSDVILAGIVEEATNQGDFYRDENAQAAFEELRHRS